MKRLYKFNEFYCGENYLDVQIYPEYIKPSKTPRKRKSKPTSEVQNALNQNNRDRYVCRLLNHNYNPCGYWVTLTYDNRHLPESFEAAEKEVNNYIRRIKSLAKKKNLPAPKIVKVTGYGERRKRLHSHLVISGEIPAVELKNKWRDKNGELRGRITIDPLEFDKFGIEKLANYILKHINENKKRSGKATYYRSRNLEEPQKNLAVRRITNREVEDIRTCTDYSVFENLYPEYEFIRPEYYTREETQEKAVYFNEHNGGYFFLLRFYKPGFWKTK